jgi:hypothetical protein
VPPRGIILSKMVPCERSLVVAFRIPAAGSELDTAFARSANRWQKTGNYLLMLFAASSITFNTSFGLDSIAT